MPDRASADFGPLAESEAGEKNGHERAKPALERATVATGEVRSLPHEPATTRGFWRDRNRVGDRVTPVALPHHRTCGSAYGGS